MTSDADQKLKAKVVIRKVKGKGAPAYLVSFGDMMTLILCFFILLVAMAKTRNFGLMARGLGSFVVTVRSMGLTGVLDGHEQQAIFEQMRRRFNLPPEDDPARRAVHEDASLKELIRASSVDKLVPHDEVRQHRIASFGNGDDELDDSSMRYLDALAEALRPRSGQTLILEGFEPDRTTSYGKSLALARGRAVEEYLVAEHDFDPQRVRVRTWADNSSETRRATPRVDGRLIFRSADDR
ncbi:OmpA family protein [bacterium]|jgi:chemotaxis protein MotB|nr:OmpA family protein [bacterium]MDB2575582.1 OmpA family protein [Planctomycetota bacterium]MDB4401577.1 OmpA family protein [bacterium]MDC1043698.1 flagellar motor protein MotB [bacterium]